jgi:phenylpropionate dioxygenase-like ring-hydroxylating dioxygenase large terminal subunit
MAIIEDHRPDSGREVPFAVRDRRHVPRERYYDRRFFDLEKQYLWPRVWQMACRLEEIPAPGDFVEYEITDQSVLVVRQRDGSVKAFHNTCRHRGTQLCKGAGRLMGGQIVCPFHGWRWNLDGSSSFVYGAQGFDPDSLDADDIRLQECLVDTWGACVWINMDRSAPPLREALSPVAHYLDPVENMRVWWWKEAVIKANWKIVVEAFHEGCHSMATHPQLMMGEEDRLGPHKLEFTTFENGHGRFTGSRDKMDAEGFIANARQSQICMDATTLERDLHVFEGMRHKVAPGEDFAAAAITALYEYAAGAGIPMPPRPENGRIWAGSSFFLFPNYIMLPRYANALALRFRPYGDDPERARLDVWSLTTYPEGREPQSRARLKGRFAPDDADNWELLYRQDMSNLERQQRGLHSVSYTGHRLATTWESLIGNMHQELDRYLAR